MMRDVAPQDAFHTIVIGDGDVVYIAHVDRVAKARVMQELEYWRGLFGDLARYDLASRRGDVVIHQLAAAITSLSKDGAGVTRDQLVGMGFAPDVVARRWDAAMALVYGPPASAVAELLPARSDPDDAALTITHDAGAAETLPSNVVRLPVRPRVVSK